MPSPASAEAQARAARDGAIVAELSHNALLSVTGDDATAFLHGQFTNDVEALPAGEAQWNGWCSPKGRLLATFLLAKRAEGYLLMLPAEIAPAIARRLAMFVLRSKVKIEDVTARHAMFGLRGLDAPGAVPVGDGRSVLIVPKEAAGETRDALAARATLVGDDAWDWTSIHAGIPTIVAATQDAFVPQMANFELVGGVSFKKGCYPGQEIVARTQYRGILKRRMALAHVGSGARPAPGQSLYSAAFGDQAAGTVVNAAPAPGGGWDLLAVAQLESLRNADLRLDSPTGTPLEIRAYPAPEAAS
jgi:folate-binding protein YgfZ